jgi:hypothetical protein
MEARPASASSAEIAYEGSLDVVDRGWIRGWVYDARHPDEMVNVDLYDDGQFVATYGANIFRPDLLVAKKGSGAHGFEIAMPDNGRDGRSHNLSVKVSGSQFELRFSPRTVTWQETWQHHEMMELTMSNLFFSRFFDALVYDQSAPVLTLVIRTGGLSQPALTLNCVQNVQFLLNHPMANHFVSSTPAEALELLHVGQREDVTTVL